MTFLALVKAQFKMLLRDRGMWILALVFPVVYAGLLGLGLRASFSQPHVAVQVTSQSPLTERFLGDLEQSGLFRTRQVSANERLSDVFAHGPTDAAIVIPRLEDGGTVRLVYDEKEPEQFFAVEQRVQLFISNFDLTVGGAKRRTALEPTGLRGPPRATFDYLLPRVLMFGVIVAVLSAGVGRAVRMRERGVFKRMMVTPLPPRQHVLSEIVTRSAVACVQTALVIAVGAAFFHGTRTLALLWLFPICVAGAVTFMCLGLMIAVLVSAPEVATGVTSVVGYFLVFVSGGLPGNLFPPIVTRLVTDLPLAPMVTAIRSVVVTHSDPLHAAKSATMLVVAWLVGSMTFALLGFRFLAPSRRG